MQRPEFDDIKDYEEFSRYYWYREELIGICKAHGLKSDGSKIELNQVIQAYFSGEMIRPEKKKVRKKKATVSDLTLDTGLIECGFTFGNRFRDFFSEQTGISPFKFNVDMVATAKSVKENGDETFTLGDLLDIYYGKKTYAKYDKSALQWNQFVKDFFADEMTAEFGNRLSAAAALWKIVRESDREKKYSRALLEEYREEIKSENAPNESKVSIGLRRGTVSVEPHNPQWEISAKQTIQKLGDVLGDVAIDIQHIGSTAIKGILAKPIIDIVVGVSDFNDLFALNDVLLTNGFIFRGQDIPEQYLYVCGEEDFRTHHIHAVIYDSEAWKNYINMRDYLNCHEEEALAYSELKEVLAKRYPEDRIKYTDSKHEMIREILMKAQEWREGT